MRGGWALCAQRSCGECGQLGLQAWASPCPQPLAVPPSPPWPCSWPPAFLLGTEREASGPLQAGGGGCGVWPLPWALGSRGQTLGPHSQLQGWMGPGHLLFNSPGSPGAAGGPQSALRNAGRTRSLAWPQAVLAAACGPLSRTPSSSSSADTGRGGVLGISHCEDFFPGRGPGSPAALRMVEGFSSGSHLCLGAPRPEPLLSCGAAPAPRPCTATAARLRGPSACPRAVRSGAADSRAGQCRVLSSDGPAPRAAATEPGEPLLRGSGQANPWRAGFCQRE